MWTRSREKERLYKQRYRLMKRIREEGRLMSWPEAQRRSIEENIAARGLIEAFLHHYQAGGIREKEE